jgi:hypothetical protein
MKLMPAMIPVMIGIAFTVPSAAVAAEPPVAAATPPAKVASAAQGTRAYDRLQLDSTAITGNRELPKVMSIVPWKAAEPPGGPDRPMGSLIEEVLAPVDRDEFKREVTYFRDLTSQSAPVSTKPASSSPGATQP